jgi:hypothetical protein
MMGVKKAPKAKTAVTSVFTAAGVCNPKCVAIVGETASSAESDAITFAFCPALWYQGMAAPGSTGGTGVGVLIRARYCRCVARMWR